MSPVICGLPGASKPQISVVPIRSVRVFSRARPKTRHFFNAVRKTICSCPRGRLVSQRSSSQTFAWIACSGKLSRVRERERERARQCPSLWQQEQDQKENATYKSRAHLEILQIMQDPNAQEKIPPKLSNIENAQLNRRSLAARKY